MKDPLWIDKQIREEIDKKSTYSDYYGRMLSAEEAEDLLRRMRDDYEELLDWILRQSTISPEILKAIQTCASAVGYAYHRHTHDHITMNDVIASEKVNRWLEKERKS